MKYIDKSNFFSRSEVEFHGSHSNDHQSSFISHLNLLSISDFRICFECCFVIENMDSRTCIIPPYLYLVFDHHNFAYSSNYVVICFNNICLVFGLVMPEISSVMTDFSAHITTAFGALWFAIILELILFLIRSKMVIHTIMLLLSFCAHCTSL